MCAQVIRESMRMFPVGGSGIGRYADKAVNLGGYLIPAGTEVAVCLHTMHMVPWNFPEPERFNPDRWLATVEEGALPFLYACSVAFPGLSTYFVEMPSCTALVRCIALPAAYHGWKREYGGCIKCMSVLLRQHVVMP